MKNLKPVVLFCCGLLLIFCGNVAAEGYDHKIEIENMVFEWKLDGETMKVRLAGKTTGWVGIGFNPSEEMKDANFIIGYVKGSKVKVTDHFGNTRRQHQSDTKLGGEKNVADISGTEENGLTDIRFTIPLNSGDARDSALSPTGETTVLLAHGAERDSFRTKHVFKTILKVELNSGKFERIK